MVIVSSTGGSIPRARVRAWTRRRRAPRLRRAGQAAAGAGEKTAPSRKVRTPKGRVVGGPTRGNPRESATETNRLSAEAAAEPRRRQGGNGAVRAHRRRGDTPARQTPPGARPSRGRGGRPPSPGWAAGPAARRARHGNAAADGWLLTTKSGLQTS